MKHVVRLLRTEGGPTVLEYAVISCMISLAAIGAMVALMAKYIAMMPH